MKTATITLIILCVILAAGLGYSYYKNPSTDISEEFANLSISAELDRERIITGYVVETLDGEVLGETSESYERIIVRKYQIIKVYNKNLEGQFFYTDYREVNVTKDSHRVDLKLEKPKEIKVEVLGGSPIKINLESEDARNVKLCLKWSLNYIFVEMVNMSEIENPKGYENWADCYEGGFSLKDSNKTIEVSYSIFGMPNEEDYIDLLLITNEAEPENAKEVKIL